MVEISNMTGRGIVCARSPSTEWAGSWPDWARRAKSTLDNTLYFNSLQHCTVIALVNFQQLLKIHGRNGAIEAKFRQSMYDEKLTYSNWLSGLITENAYFSPISSGF